MLTSSTTIDGSLGLLTLGSLGSFVNRPTGGSFFGPNSSLGGNLRKAWERREDGSTVLVKSGSVPYRQEPVNELIATMLYQRLLDPEDYVSYELEYRDGKAYSVCEDMVDRSECFIPAWDIINAYKMPGSISPWMHVKNCYDRLGVDGAERQLSKMLVCDYIIANSDRHWGNFGIIFDRRDDGGQEGRSHFRQWHLPSCWSPILESDLDFWYRPLPMIRERAGGFTLRISLIS